MTNLKSETLVDNGDVTLIENHIILNEKGEIISQLVSNAPLDTYPGVVRKYRAVVTVTEMQGEELKKICDDVTLAEPTKNNVKLDPLKIGTVDAALYSTTYEVADQKGKVDSGINIYSENGEGRIQFGLWAPNKGPKPEEYEVSVKAKGTGKNAQGVVQDDPRCKNEYTVKQKFNLVMPTIDLIERSDGQPNPTLVEIGIPSAGKMQTGFVIQYQQKKNDYHAEYSFIQIINTYQISYMDSLDVKRAEINKQDKKILDIYLDYTDDPEGTPFYKNKFFNSNNIIELQDEPTAIICQSLIKNQKNPLCTTSDMTFGKVKEVHYFLSFSSYLMMKVDTGLQNLKGVSYWIPVKNFKWSTDLNATCDGQEACTPPTIPNDNGWRLDGKTKLLSEPVSSLLPSWEGSAFTYNNLFNYKKVPDQESNNNRYPCFLVLPPNDLEEIDTYFDIFVNGIYDIDEFV